MANVIQKLMMHTKYRTINSIPTHLNDEEKIKLLQLSKEIKGVFVEIGSYYGSSSCFIAEGIRQSGKQSILYCIDTWQNYGMTEGKKDTYQQFIEGTKKISWDNYTPPRVEL